MARQDTKYTSLVRRTFEKHKEEMQDFLLSTSEISSVVLKKDSCRSSIENQMIEVAYSSYYNDMKSSGIVFGVLYTICFSIFIYAVLQTSLAAAVLSCILFVFSVAAKALFHKWFILAALLRAQSMQKNVALHSALNQIREELELSMRLTPEETRELIFRQSAAHILGYPLETVNDFLKPE